jgi:hypothetical protein
MYIGTYVCTQYKKTQQLNFFEADNLKIAPLHSYVDVRAFDFKGYILTVGYYNNNSNL